MSATLQKYDHRTNFLHKLGLFHFRLCQKAKSTLQNDLHVYGFKELGKFISLGFLYKMSMLLPKILIYFSILFPDNTQEYCRTQPILTVMHMHQQNYRNLTHPQYIL